MAFIALPSRRQALNCVTPPFTITQTRFIQNNRAGNRTRTKSFRYRSHHIHMRGNVAAGSKLDDSSRSCSNAEEEGGSGLQIAGQGRARRQASFPSLCQPNKQIPSICTVASSLWGLLCPPSATFSNPSPNPLPSVAGSKDQRTLFCFVLLYIARRIRPWP